MTNPLDGPPRTGIAPRTLAIGETMTIQRSDGVKIVIERTARPYAEDLCDAYNDAMSEDARDRGCSYYVDKQGQVKLGFSEAFTGHNSAQLARKAERERQDWMHRQRFPIDDSDA